jgi:hypothetical protein
MHPGHYVEYGTYVKVRVEVTSAYKRLEFADAALDIAPTSRMVMGGDGSVSHCIIIGNSTTCRRLVSRFQNICESAPGAMPVVVHIAPRHGNVCMIVVEGLLSSVGECWRIAVDDTGLTTPPLFNSGLSVPKPLYGFLRRCSIQLIDRLNFA